MSVTQLVRILMDRVGKGAQLKKAAERFATHVRISFLCFTVTWFVCMQRARLVGFNRPVEYFYIIVYSILSSEPALLQLGQYDSARGAVSISADGLAELNRLNTQQHSPTFLLAVPPVLVPIVDESKSVADDVVAAAFDDAYWDSQVRLLCGEGRIIFDTL